MQLETCHLGRVQGRQVTRASGSHGGSRPRLSEEDKERAALRRVFVRETLKGRQWEGIAYDDYLLILLRYDQGFSQAQCAEMFLKDQSTICRWETRVLSQLKKLFEEGA